jgi:hypothetical protein
MSAGVGRFADYARALQADLLVHTVPSLEVQRSTGESVLPRRLFEDTRGYLLQITDQINECYERACYDACAVMIRRLVEVLIIEAFDRHGAEAEILDKSGNYVFLEELTNKALATSQWRLGRNTKSGLKRLKVIGDQSAHSRRYNAKRPYIDGIVHDLRVVSEEFLYLSGLRE